MRALADRESVCPDSTTHSFDCAVHALPSLRAGVDSHMDRMTGDRDALRQSAAGAAPAVTALDASAWLPRLSAGAARGLTHAYAARAPLALTIGGRAYELTWRVDADPVADAGVYRFAVGAARGTLWIDPSAETEWLGDAADPLVPAVLRAALLADHCAPLAAALQALTRQRVELLPPGGPQPPEAPRNAPSLLRFELQRTDSNWSCHGALLFDVPDALGVFFGAPPGNAAAARHAATTQFAALPVRLAFALGRTSLTTHELVDVVAGDIIAIEHWRSHGQALHCIARIDAGRRWEIEGRTADNRIIVERIREMPLEPSHSPDRPRTHAADSKDSNADPATPASAPRQFDGLAVELTFQLPPCSMPLGELGTLQPGGVIETGQAINQSVIQIVANGMLIGTGHLIAVGQKLGVRVATLTPPTAHPPRERQDG
jgi:type III secretion protein Q